MGKDSWVSSKERAGLWRTNHRPRASGSIRRRTPWDCRGLRCCLEVLPVLLSKQEATPKGQRHLITSVKISKNSKVLTGRNLVGFLSLFRLERLANEQYAGLNLDIFWDQKVSVE